MRKTLINFMIKFIAIKLNSSNTFKYILVFCLIVSTSLILFSQDIPNVINKPLMTYSTTELKRLAANEIKFKNYTAAANYLEQYVKFKPTNYKAMFKLGECYFKINNFEKAAKYFYASYEKSNNTYYEALFMAADMHKIMGNCIKAKEYYTKFKKEASANKKHDKLKRQIKSRVLGCDSIQAKIANQKNVFITHLDSNINKVNIEQSPFFIDSNTFVYSAVRLDNQKIELPIDTVNTSYRKLYSAKFQNQEWQYDSEFGTNLILENLLLANAYLNTTTNRLYLTYCNENYFDKRVCKLYVSTKNSNGEFSVPVLLDKNINYKNYNSTQPTTYLDPQKNIEYVYYSSNRKDGKGGYDIWMFTYNLKSKKYSLPKNISKINSESDDITPQFNSKNKSLTFSSNGFDGAGGYDVFKAYGEKQKFSKPSNLLYINSSYDDLSYVETPNSSKGLFTSNRTGSNGKTGSPNCCDDLYLFEINKKLERNIHIDVFSLQNNLSSKLEVGSLKLQIKNVVDGNTTIIDLPISADNNLKFIPEPNLSYQLLAESENHLSKVIDLLDKDLKLQELSLSISLEKISTKPVIVPNINYATNKFDLTNEAKLSIDTTIYKYLLDNPLLKFEIRSHTDNVGSDQSNQLLSQKRAQGVVNYLMQKGITKERLTAQGYGEKLPIETNETEVGRQKNRRTDFIVIGKLVVKENTDE